MNVQALESPVLSAEALEITLGHFAGDSEQGGRAKTQDNDDCKDSPHCFRSGQVPGPRQSTLCLNISSSWLSYEVGTIIIPILPMKHREVK